MHALDLLWLAGGVLVFTSVLAGVLSARLGLPSLLVFLCAGMLVGVDAPLGVRLDSPQLVAWVGNTALAMKLLEGGISTRMQTFRTGLGPALLLGQLTLDAELPLAGVFEFCQLPLPGHRDATLRDWMTDNLARDHLEGDGVSWHGAHFHVIGLREGRVARAGLALSPRPRTL